MSAKQDVLDIINNCECISKEHTIFGVKCYHIETGSRQLHLKIASDSVKLVGQTVLYSSSLAQTISDVQDAVDANLEAAQAPAELEEVSLSAIKSEMGI